MQDDVPPPTIRCETCGREYAGKRPTFCLTCGTRLGGAQEPKQVDPAPSGTAGGARAPAPVTPPQAAEKPVRKPRRDMTKVLIILAVIVVLAAGAVAGVVVAMRLTRHAAPMPTTAAEMRDAVTGAQDYLNGSWKNLASGRVKGATIYSVTTKLDTDTNTVGGTARILYTNNTGVSLSEIILRVYANSKVVNPSGAGASVSSTKVDGRNAVTSSAGSIFHIALPAILEDGKEALVEIAFNETVPEVQTGLGGIEQLLGQGTGGGYGVLGRSGNVYDLGYFIPTVLTYGPTGWDQRDVPALGDIGDFDCAYYVVALDVPGGFVVAAPGVSSGVSSSAGRKTFEFRGGPMRDFTAQASPDYKVASAREGETVVSSYFLKDGAGNGRKALGYARRALKEYNAHFGSYPYVGLNVCEAALGGGAGGMEFAGQVQIAKMLYGDLGSLAGSQGTDLSSLLGSLGSGLLGDMMEFTVAHEVCHQWWGLTVGNDSIDHPWQDESLTNYCTVLYFRWAHGADAAKKQLDTEITLPYSAGQLMGAGGDMVVDTPVAGFANEAQYSAIVYSKGALFFQALETQMGAPAFEKSLRQYYDAYAFRNATPAELVSAFETNGNADSVAQLHRRWILETHASEDIATTNPGMDILNDLLKQLPGGLDLNNLEDLLNQFMPNGSMPQMPGLEDNGSNALPI